jgi:endo-1,4-beta-D-glucanase Y
MKRNALRCLSAISGLFVLLQVGLGGCASERFGSSPEPLADAGAPASSISTASGDAGFSPLQSPPDAGQPPASDVGIPEAGPGGAVKRGPTAPTAGSQYPFPQNRRSSACTYPSHYSNADVQTAYAQWKKDLITADGADGHLRVQRTASDGVDACRPLASTVSEGIAYGMLASVYMNDEALFDGLWLFEQGHLDANGLMNWAPEGSGPDCGGAATDADEDMAFALVMADRQWGGQGSIGQPYKQAAITMIGQIWNTEVFQSKWLRAGDGDWATNTNLNVSYLSPAYYKVFRNIDPNTSHDWNALVDGSYSTIADALTGNQNQSNGLVPAWCDDSSQTTCQPGSPGNYQYDSCRTPFRIGLDWCWSSEPRALAYVQKTSTFFAGVGASRIADGYALDGTPMPAHVGQLAAAFVGPAAVGAMSAPAYQAFLDDAYSEVATGTLEAGGAYYEESWTLLSLLMMTGNFVDYSSL